MLVLNDGRSELFQWDTGRTLAVDVDCAQVHFSNKVFGRSVDVDVVDGVAIIPDFLLQTDKELTAWAFVGTAENGYTKISKTFKVNRRNKPDDYVFTPPEQMTIQEIKAIAQSVRDDADAGLFNGERGKKGDKGDTGETGVGVAAMVYDGAPNPREIYVDYYATNLYPGRTYKVTVDVLGRLELLSGSAPGKMSISLIPRDVNNTVLGAPVQGSSVVPIVTNWKTLEWTVTIPSGATKPVFRVGFYNAFGTAYVDNLKITQLTPTVADVKLIDPGFEAALESNQKTGGWTFDDWNINFVSRSGEAASDGAYSAKLQYGLTTQWKIIYTDGSEHPITAPMFSSGASGEGGTAPHIGANGNWYLGEVDTGVKAVGEDGVGIMDIQKRTVNGQDVLHITLSDDTEKDFPLPSGKNGKDGVGIASVVYDGSPSAREIYVDYYANNLTQGETYKVTVDVMGRLEMLFGGVAGKVGISLVPRGSNNAVVGSPVQGTKVIPDTSGWKTLEWTVKIPSNAVQPVFRVSFYNAFGIVYLDNLTIKHVSSGATMSLTNPSFEDGLTTDLIDRGWRYDTWNIDYVSISSDVASNGTKSAKLQYGMTTNWKIIYTDGSEQTITAPMFASGS